MKTILGYSDKISVTPGEPIAFMVTSEAEKPFSARIVRVINGDTNPQGPGYREEPIASEVDGTYRGARQRIHAGSFAVVPAAPALEGLSSFTFQAMIWPTTPGRGEQVIASFWDEGAGFELYIDGSGALSGRVGDGRGLIEVISSGRSMLPRHWYLAALSLDADEGVLRVLQSPLKAEVLAPDTGSAAVPTEVKALGRAGPLVFAARPEDASAERGALHYNGKIDSPRLYARAMSGPALASFPPTRTITAKELGLVGAWDFSEDMHGVSFGDRSSHGLKGRLVQMPMRAVVGYNWRDDVRDWRQAPAQYGAVHFHDDDVHDAAWAPSVTWSTPSGLRSGLYALHLSTDDDEDYVPFVVRPAPDGPHAKAVLVLPTASYMAYGNEHMAIDFAHAERVHDMAPSFNANDLFLMEHREYGVSLYDVHSDGGPVCYASRLRPYLNMRVKYQSWLAGVGSALWQLPADTHLINWLEALDLDCDIMTDEDVHYGGVEALKPYRCVLTGSHPEYISTEIWDALESYKALGGNLMALGGNAFLARIAYHPTLPGVIEIRRNGMPAGEAHHSFNGEYGGLWSGIGREPNTMAGTGFVGQGFDLSSYYRRGPASYSERAAFIFEGVEEEVIGDFGLIGGGAAGLELDKADVDLGTPAHALVLASSENHTGCYMLSGKAMVMNMAGLDATQNPQLRADLVFFETPSGGGVFSTGSIAWAGSLSHNDYRNNVSRITANVLRRFTSGEPFLVA